MDTAQSFSKELSSRKELSFCMKICGLGSKQLCQGSRWFDDAQCGAANNGSRRSDTCLTLKGVNNVLVSYKRYKRRGLREEVQEKRYKRQPCG